MKSNIKKSNSKEEKDRAKFSAEIQENANSARTPDLVKTASKSSLKSVDSQDDGKIRRAKSASVRFYIQPPDVGYEGYSENHPHDFPKLVRPKSSLTRTNRKLEETVELMQEYKSNVKKTECDKEQEHVGAENDTSLITDTRTSADVFEQLQEMPKFVRPKSAFTRTRTQTSEDESNPIKSSMAELEQIKENIPKLIRAKSAFSRSLVKFSEPEDSEEMSRAVRSQSALTRPKIGQDSEVKDTLKALRLLEKERLERMKILIKLQRPILTTSDKNLYQYTSEYLDQAKQEKYEQFKHARPYYKSRYKKLIRPISYFSFKRLSSTSLGDIDEREKSFLEIKQLELKVNAVAMKPKLIERRVPNRKRRSGSHEEFQIDLEESEPIINEYEDF